MKFLKIVLALCLTVIIWETENDSYCFTYVREYQWMGTNALKFKDMFGEHIISGGAIYIDEVRNF